MRRTLYHFPLSTFSRRARLALAHKGLSADLVDGRAEPERLAEARRICPLRTMPVLVEEDGRAIGDSTAIAHYLDAAYPDAPRLWPAEKNAARETLEATTLVDLAMSTIVDLGTRYYALHDAPAWGAVKAEMIGRAQAALDALATRAAARAGTTWTDAGWCVADAWILTATLWVEGWAARAPTNPMIGQLTGLGVRLPAEMARWSDTHRARADVVALG